jgi:hypothetical protein
VPLLAGRGGYVSAFLSGFPHPTFRDLLCLVKEIGHRDSLPNLVGCSTHPVTG